MLRGPKKVVFLFVIVAVILAGCRREAQTSGLQEVSLEKEAPESDGQQEEEEAGADLEGTVGLWQDYAATYNLGRYVTDYLNAPLVWDTASDYSRLEEVAAMPAFPAAGAVEMIDGTVVVKLS